MNDLSTAEQIVADLIGTWHRGFRDLSDVCALCEEEVETYGSGGIYEDMSKHTPACPYRRAVEYMKSKGAQC